MSNGGAAGVHLQSPAYTDPSSAPLQLSSTAAVAVAVTTVAAAQVVVGYEPCGDDGACYVREFPRRPGKQQCEFYAKTGHCKFGDTCCFDHPPEFAVQLSPLGLPLRPDQPLCTFYLKNNECRFGPSCKFHHPMLRPILAGSSMAPPPDGNGAL